MIRNLLTAALVLLPLSVTAQSSGAFLPTIDEIQAIQENIQAGKRPVIIKESDTRSLQEREALMKRLNTNFKARRGNATTTQVRASSREDTSAKISVRNTAKERLQQRKSRLMR